VDVARQGKDKLVYTLLKGGNIHLIEHQNYTENTMEIVSKVERFLSEYHINPGDVVIDGVGVGAGVVDRLHEKQIYVTNFIGGASPTDSWDSVFTYANLKSQAYWGLKEKMKSGQLGGLVHPTLKQELASIWVTYDEKVIKVESKDKYKTRNGKSPDFSDSLMYAYWAKYRHEFVPHLEPFSV
jgi:phage terminase large subunit